MSFRIVMTGRTRQASGGRCLDPEIVFPPSTDLQPKSQLPTKKGVMCLIRQLLLPSPGHAAPSTPKAVKEVAKMVYAKWYHDTVYCVSLRTVERMVTSLWNVFKEGKKRWKVTAGENYTRKSVTSYIELVDTCNQLFDIVAVEEARKRECEADWGVTKGCEKKNQ